MATLPRDRPTLAPGPASKRRRLNVEGRALEKMHPDSKYRAYTPDFAELARLYPAEFGTFVIHLDDEKTEAVIDWEDHEAVRALTKILLRHDFGLEWDIPGERLCPPVPNRLNYICWLKELLSLGRHKTDAISARGIDIGTGASCIYALLGAVVYKWSFLATDIDSVAVEVAETNVGINGLEDKIRIKQVQKRNYALIARFQPVGTKYWCSTDEVDLKADDGMKGPLLTALEGEDDDHRWDFCMCNPPFFESLEEVGPEAHGCLDEIITPGGEVAFVMAIVKDSLRLKDKVLWYTSMVGKKGTLRRILAALRESHVSNVHTTEFLQGRTTRWGIAWSFSTQGLAELEGEAAASHKVFGRKKLEKKRDTRLCFVVGPTSEGEPVDEGAVIQRLIDFLHETRQVHVLSAGVGKGGAEDLYRQVIRAVLSSEASAAASSSGRADVNGVAAKGMKSAVSIDHGSAEWRKRCAIVVTVVAGAAGDVGRPHDEEPRPTAQAQAKAASDVEQNAKHEEGVLVTVELTSGGDRAAFWKLADVMGGEVGRTNRRWRRKLMTGSAHSDAAAVTKV